jgi:hypothetical protein
LGAQTASERHQSFTTGIREYKVDDDPLERSLMALMDGCVVAGVQLMAVQIRHSYGQN